jgi:hypothetical protein
MTITMGAARGIVRRAGLVAIAAVALTAATQERAHALSLATPGAVPAATYASENFIEVRGGHGGGRGGGGFHGGGGFRGGGGFHGGGFRGGAIHGGGVRSSGFAYRSGGFRAAHIYRGGGHRYSGLRYGGARFAYHRPFVHRRHFHRRFYAPYTYSNYYPRCRIVWTYYGPRKICPWRYNYAYRPYGSYW